MIGHRARKCVYLLTLIGFQLVAPSVSRGETDLEVGLWTQVWPWMWLDGKPLDDQSTLGPAYLARWRFAEDNLRRISELGAAFNLVTVRQRSDGPDGWKRIRAIVDYHRTLGLGVAFRLIEDSTIYTAIRSGKPDNALERYGEWVHSLASEFAGEVSFYLVSNEVDHNFGANVLPWKDFRITYEEYQLVQRTAYRAAKLASPDAFVVDHGVSAYTLGLAVANSVLGKDGAVAGYEFWKKFMFGSEARAGTLLQFIRLMQSPDTSRRIEIAKKTFSEATYSDLHQIHWYFGADAFPKALQWVAATQQAAGASKPLFLSELGYRIPTTPGSAWDGRPTNVADWDKYNEEDHASNLVKTFALAIGSGIRQIQYWQLRQHHHRDASAQLYLPTEVHDQFRPTLSVSSFVLFANMAKAKLVSADCEESADEWVCTMVFSDVRYSVVWRKSGTSLMDVSPDATHVFDYLGHRLNHAGVVELSTTPLVFASESSPQAEELPSQGTAAESRETRPIWTSDGRGNKGTARSPARDVSH